MAGCVLSGLPVGKRRPRLTSALPNLLCSFFDLRPPANGDPQHEEVKNRLGCAGLA